MYNIFIYFLNNSEDKIKEICIFATELTRRCTFPAVRKYLLTLENYYLGTRKNEKQQGRIIAQTR